MPKFSFPYLPQPLDDEIFGSWVRRIRLLNGEGAWSAFLSDSGMKHLGSSFFNIVAHSSGFEGVLGILGTSYQAYLKELTAYPILAAFNSALSPKAFLTGTELPALRTHGRLVSAPSARAGRSGHMEGIAYCPKCIADDMEVVGEPYLRRNHQLRGVLACSTHRCWLRTGCPNCGRMTAEYLRHKLVFRAPICDCGVDLRLLISDAEVPDFFLKYVDLACEILRAGPIYNERDSVKRFFGSILMAHKGHQDLSPVEAILDKVGVVFRREGGGYKADCGMSNAEGSFNFSGVLQLWSYTEYITTMVSSDLVIQDLVCGAQAHKKQRKFRRATDKITDSRLNELKRQYYKRKLPQIHYWLLRVNWPEFDELFPSIAMRFPMRSVASDRADVTKLIKIYHGQGKTLPHGLMTSALSRTRARDAEWLIAKTTEIYRGKKRLGNTKASAPNPAARRLMETIEELERANEAPIRQGLQGLATRAGITREQAERALAVDRRLTERVNNFFDEYRYIRIKWAVKHFLGVGRIPGIKKICAKAGTSASDCRDLIERAFSEVGAY